MILFSVGGRYGYLSNPDIFLLACQCVHLHLLVFVPLPFLSWSPCCRGCYDQLLKWQHVDLLINFCFILPSAVFIRIVFPSKSIHVGVICGEPSFIKVATKAKFFPVNSDITDSSISLLICMFFLWY